jgi:hypothetical protein
MATGELFGWLLIHVIGGFICGIIAHRVYEDKKK